MDRLVDRFLSLILVLTLQIFASKALALEGTDTLPEGVYSPSVVHGFVYGLNNRFTESGALVSQGDFRAISLDANNLRQFNSEFDSLVNVLDSFGHYQLGQQLNPGRLRVDLNPQVTFWAPNLAYGISDKWTVAAVLPVANYRNQVRITQEGSNVDEIRKEVEGSSEELDAAFDQLSGDLDQALLQEVSNSGYRTLDQRDEQILGDLQLVSIYRFYENTNWGVSVQNILNLPTGDHQDPSDLLSLDIFGRTSLSADILVSRKINSRLTFNSYFGHEYFFADNVRRRVPRDSADLIPPPSRETNVNRKIGGLTTIGANGTYSFTDSIGVGLDLMYNNKEKDQFSGGIAGDYETLARFSDSSWLQLTTQIQYSSVEAFKKNKIMIPFMVIYNYGQILHAVNREQQKLHMLAIRMFFK